MNFLTQKKTAFPISEKFKTWTFSAISKYHLSFNFLAQKRLYILSLKISKQERFNNQLTWNSMLKKISFYRFLRIERSSFSVLKTSCSFVNTKEISSFYQLSALKKISFYSQKSLISLFPLSKKFIIWTFSFFLIWTFFSFKVHAFVISSFFHRNLCFL